VQRRPRTIAALSCLVLLAIAAPATALRLGSSDASNDPASRTTHRAYELLAEGFGQGFNGPLQVVAKVPHGTATTAALAGLRKALESTRDVASVTPARVSPSGEVATFSVYPNSSPQAYATTQLVERLREDVVPPIVASTKMTVYVGGVTAGAVDFASTLGHKLPLFIGVVVLLSALLLMVVFRSLLIPLQAAAMNLLSISAALGVIVAIFQWGWLSGLMGVEKGPIESFIPVMLFAIVFGLSMDYEVFLISRIHERWRQTLDGNRAVGEGLALTGRVITAAAAIMVLVFLSFMLGEERVIKEFGLSLASAVFLDALVVRCLLLPAVLHLVGERTWWIPAWLDRVLPRLNIEGTELPADAPPEGEAPPHTPPAGAPRSPRPATEGAEG
ncbi:MAG TPA: MMPL family transporter, partial [Solirubrobacteraceae bacterium]|nr:MMPL family transporter [Solirubrobacteraceae bacterium]